MNERFKHKNHNLIVLNKKINQKLIAEKLKSKKDKNDLILVFQEDEIIFALKTKNYQSYPCPMCVLYYLANDFDLLKELESRKEDIQENSSKINEENIDLILKNIKQNSLISIDLNQGVTENTPYINKHFKCDHSLLNMDDFGLLPKSIDPLKINDSQYIANHLEQLFINPIFGIIRHQGSLRKLRKLDFLKDSHYYIYYSWHEYPPFKYARSNLTIPHYDLAIGGDQNEKLAKIKSSMEALERYVILLQNESNTECFRETESKYPILNPNKFYFFQSEQYEKQHIRFNPYSENTKYTWVPVQHIKTNKTVYVHEDFVYMVRRNAIKPIFRNTSNGCAAHFNLEKALINGILELFERDAMMYGWYSYQNNPYYSKILSESLQNDFRKDIEFFEKLNYEIQILELTRFKPFHSFLITIKNTENDDRFPAVVAGSGCHFNRHQALKKTFGETIVNFTGGYTVRTEEKKQNIHMAQIERPEHHALFYQDYKNRDLLNQFIESGRTINYEKETGIPNLSFNDLKTIISKLNIDVYFQILTPESLRKLGLFVVRCLSPDLIPLHFGINNHMLFKPDSSEKFSIPNIPHLIP